MEGGALSARKLRDSLLAKRPNPEMVLSLLLELSYVEDISMEVFGALIDERSERWATLRSSVASKISELSQFYLGDTPLTAKMKDEGLASYFGDLAKSVTALELSDNLVGESGRKIQSILNAIEDLMRFHQIEASLQTKQHLLDVKRELQRMVLVANLKDRNLTTLINVSDVGYVFGDALNVYSDLMRGRVCRHPSSVGQLRCFFLKLSRSVVEPPLMRINECDSADLASVCEHYSGCVVTYVESILASVPEAMLDTLLEAAGLARSVPALAEPPSRIERAKLREYAVPDIRRKMAALSRRVAELAAGILHMETAFLGVIEIDPVKVLEVGLRESLAHKALLAVDSSLTFQSVGFADEDGRAAPPLPYPPGRVGGALAGELGGGGGKGAAKKRAKAAGERHASMRRCLTDLKGKLDALTSAFALVFDYTGGGGPTAFDDALGDVLWSLCHKETAKHGTWRRARLTQLTRAAPASFVQAAR